MYLGGVSGIPYSARAESGEQWNRPSPAPTGLENASNVQPYIRVGGVFGGAPGNAPASSYTENGIRVVPMMRNVTSKALHWLLTKALPSGLLSTTGSIAYSLQIFPGKTSVAHSTPYGSPFISHTTITRLLCMAIGTAHATVVAFLRPRRLASKRILKIVVTSSVQ